MTDIIIPLPLILILQIIGIFVGLGGVVALFSFLAWTTRDEKIIMGMMLFLALMFGGLLLFAGLTLLGYNFVIK